MGKHIECAKYLARHKWYVLVAGLSTGAPVWRLIVHDWSKLLPSEWFPYVEFFHGGGRTDSGVVEFNRAWLLHIHRNAHHWQHWVLHEDDGPTFALEMPEPVVREMVADWAGAGRALTGEWVVGEWYAENKGSMTMHTRTRALVGHVLEEFDALVR